MRRIIQARTLCCALALSACTKKMEKPPSAPDAAPAQVAQAPRPAAQAPAPVPTPPRFAGGIVTLGPYKDDAPGWGRREVHLGPFIIDAKVTPGLTFEACQQRGGRLPRADELEHALRAGLIERSVGPEQTSSLAVPRDNNELASAEGVGFYPVLLDGVERVVVVSPEAENGKPARCLIPQETPPAPTARTLARDVEPRRGRGAEWPPVTGFYALGEHRVVPPLVLHRGSQIGALQESGEWVLISALPDSDDPLGWVRATDLSPLKRKAPH